MFVIDSHTGGQPTRVIIEGGPDLSTGPLSERVAIFEDRFDVFRRKSVLEPKCSDAMVGALLCEPFDPKCSAGVIFFNTAGYLGMCGHGTMGLMVTLAHLGRLSPGTHYIETPVGIVETKLLNANEVQVVNVESYCLKQDVSLKIKGIGTVKGHIAWGGNWFFLVESIPITLRPENIPALTQIAQTIKTAVNALPLGDIDIDHIEFFEPAHGSNAHSRNFVLCPGGAYDRSPCGTGTSAKLACLAAKGELASGELWIQESIIGSQFKASYKGAETPGHIIPTITGQAYIYGETTLVFDPADPFQQGVAL